MGRGIFCAESCVNHIRAPTFSSIQLIIGDDNISELGIEKVIQFIQTLCNLPVRIEVDYLRLYFANFCWSEEIGPVVFAGALREKIKVRRGLEMAGNNVHWTFFMRAIPIQLGMKVQPVECKYSHHNDEDKRLGSFNCTYEPAEKWNDRVGCDADGMRLELDDPRARFIEQSAPKPFVPAKEPFRPARSYNQHLPAQGIRTAEDIFPELVG